MMIFHSTLKLSQKNCLKTSQKSLLPCTTDKEKRVSKSSESSSSYNWKYRSLVKERLHLLEQEGPGSKSQPGLLLHGGHMFSLYKTPQKRKLSMVASSFLKREKVKIPRQILKIPCCTLVAPAAEVTVFTIKINTNTKNTKINK
ncbi:hypothetical protein CRENBAI_019292 [Crenichthys baileyi]|uniref:Uncharacterized protein n=1 Tax=Crenichthys baileyi TaxID=28760 RepID=A0AAV9R8D0_9TELE